MTCFAMTDVDHPSPTPLTIKRGEVSSTTVYWDVDHPHWLVYKPFLVQFEETTVGKLKFRFITCGGAESGYHEITTKEHRFVYDKAPSLLPDAEAFKDKRDVGVLCLNVLHRPADFMDDIAWKALTDDATSGTYDMGQGKWPKGAENKQAKAAYQAALELYNLARLSILPGDAKYPRLKDLGMTLHTLSANFQ